MKLAKNMGALFVVQGSLYLIPLLATPYLTRALGVDSFGALGIATSLVNYIGLITDWGFPLSSLQAVALNAKDPEALRRIFWRTTLAKALLAALCIPMFILIVAAWAPIRELWLPILGASLIIPASILGSGWFLQGLERMVAFSMVTFATRLLTLPLLLIFVHSANDVATAAFIQSGALLLSSIISIGMCIRYAPIWPIPKIAFREIVEQIRDGGRMFIATGAISLYTLSNVVLLGLWAGHQQAGYFSAAERVKRAVQQATEPISTAMFPRINHMMSYQPAHVFRSMRNMLFAQGGLTLALSVLLFVAAPAIATHFLGKDYGPATSVIQWLSPAPFLFGVSNVLGLNIMVPLGMKAAFTRILLLSGIFNIALILPLSHFFGANGAAASVTATELVVMTMMGIHLWIHRREIRRRQEAAILTATRSAESLKR